MNTGFRILALLLLLVFGTAGTALAQDYSNTGAPAQSSDPAPVNPVMQPYDNGAMIVIVRTPAPDLVGAHSEPNYGYRIGSRIPIQIDFGVKPGMALNLDNLLFGQFDLAQGSDVEMAKELAPVISPQFDQEGYTWTRVKIWVRTWTMKESVTFNSTFLYAKEILPNGTPNWQKAVTPDFVVTRSFTAVNSSKNLDEGDLSVQSSPHPAPVAPMRMTGLVLGFVPLAFVVWGIFLWANPPRQIAEHERAWAVFNRVLKSNDPAQGLSYDGTNEVAAALRQYLQVGPLATPYEIKQALAGFYAKRANRYELATTGEEAFIVFEKALYERPEDGAKIALSADETRQLVKRIERLVPRP